MGRGLPERVAHISPRPAPKSDLSAPGSDHRLQVSARDQITDRMVQCGCTLDKSCPTHGDEHPLTRRKRLTGQKTFSTKRLQSRENDIKDEPDEVIDLVDSQQQTPSIGAVHDALQLATDEALYGEEIKNVDALDLLHDHAKRTGSLAISGDSTSAREVKTAFVKAVKAVKSKSKKRKADQQEAKEAEGPSEVQDMTDHAVLLEHVMARAPPGVSQADIKKVEQMVKTATSFEWTKKRKTDEKEECVCGCHQAIPVQGICCGNCRPFHQRTVVDAAWSESGVTSGGEGSKKRKSSKPPKEKKSPKRQKTTKEASDEKTTDDGQKASESKMDIDGKDEKDEKKEMEEKKPPLLHRFSSKPKPWTTTPLECSMTFCVRLSDGLICQEWHSVKEGKEQEFPSEMKFRQTASNLKRMKGLLDLVERSRHTCRVFAGHYVSFKGYTTQDFVKSKPQTHIFLKFGRTQEEDLEFGTRQRQAAEAKRQEETKARQDRLHQIQALAKREFWKDAAGQPTTRLRTRDFDPVKGEEIMTEEARAAWRRHLIEVTKEAMSQYVMTAEFCGLMMGLKDADASVT